MEKFKFQRNRWKQIQSNVKIAEARSFLKKHEGGFYFAAGSAGMNTRWSISRIF
jgi:hypothetical protein